MGREGQKEKGLGRKENSPSPPGFLRFFPSPPPFFFAPATQSIHFLLSLHDYDVNSGESS